MLLSAAALAAIEQARRPAQRRRPRVRVALAPALIRSTVRAIEPIALANRPESVGYATSVATTVVSARILGAQQIRGGRLGWPQKRLIQPRDRIVAVPGGDLHHRGRCGSGSGKTVARKGNRPPPGTTTHGPTGAELQKHQPQVGLHRDRRAADPGIEIRGEPREKHRIIQRRRPNSDRQHQQLGRQNSPRVEATTKFDRGRFGCD